VPRTLLVLIQVESTFPPMTQINEVQGCGQPGIRPSDNENLEWRLFFETRHGGDQYNGLWVILGGDGMGKRKEVKLGAGNSTRATDQQVKCLNTRRKYGPNYAGM
jgi:hypothetical protein